MIDSELSFEVEQRLKKVFLDSFKLRIFDIKEVALWNSRQISKIVSISESEVMNAISELDSGVIGDRSRKYVLIDHTRLIFINRTAGGER